MPTQPLRIERLQQIELDTAGQSYRYYLVWITSMVAADGGYRVEVTEVRLFD